MGIFLTLIHDVTGNGLSGVESKIRVLGDRTEVFLIVVAILRYVASVISMRMALRNGHQMKDGID